MKEGLPWMLPWFGLCLLTSAVAYFSSRDQPLHWDNNFREKTTLGLPRGEFVRAKKAHP